MIQVHVQHRFLRERPLDLVFLESDEERPLGRRPGQVGRIPAAVLQVKILVLLKPKQDHGLPLTRGGVPAKEKGVFALQFGELARVGRHHADRIAKRGPEIGGHAQIAVGDVVEHFVTRHGVLPTPSGPLNGCRCQGSGTPTRQNL